MIGIDWGTSSFRAYRLGAEGTVLERRAAARGILSVTDGDFARVLAEEIGDWPDDGPVLMSGMIGSRQGWREIPYVACPADLAGLARGGGEVAFGIGRRAWIVPGVSCRDAAGVPDVMRGEETQILGALADLQDEIDICLPGTHSKHASVRGGTLTGFVTYLTGEAFGALWNHTILGRLGGSGEVVDDTAFDAGVDRSVDAAGLLHHLFGVRSRGLFGELQPQSLAAYLSGILIGHEIRAAATTRPVAVIGAPELTRLYLRAFGRCGVESRAVPGEPVTRGLWTIGRMLGGNP